MCVCVRVRYSMVLIYVCILVILYPNHSPLLAFILFIFLSNIYKNKNYP